MAWMINGSFVSGDVLTLIRKMEEGQELISRVSQDLHRALFWLDGDSVWHNSIDDAILAGVIEPVCEVSDETEWILVPKGKRAKKRREKMSKRMLLIRKRLRLFRKRKEKEVTPDLEGLQDGTIDAIDMELDEEIMV